MCVGAKTTVVDSPAQGLSISNQAMNGREQSYADSIQSHYNPQTVMVDPNKLVRDTVSFNQLTKAIDQSGQGDENYVMRERVRNQINDNLAGDDPALRRQMMQSGLSQAFLSGANPSGTLSRGAAITADVMGRDYLNYRQNARTEAQNFMNQNQSKAALPSGMELSGIDIINRQQLAQAANQKQQALADLGMWSIGNENQRNQQELGALQQWAGNRATMMNNQAGANAAAKGALIGAGIQAVGSIAGGAL